MTKKRGDIWIHVPNEDGAATAFLMWYRQNAMDVIHRRVTYYSDILGQKPKAVRVKSVKSIWGSCSVAGNLSFNWKLIMAPPWILDYVVVHELCHLVFRHHGPDFWALVSHYYPRFREARRWLRLEGVGLWFPDEPV